ncbi:MAG TPA: hypothetical protein ENJ82_03285, partial [Bacteroidetes bacterium]|nr:hypothetical protein [Bacteroidota bacterium]
MRRFKLYLTFAMTLLFLSGCVSKKKYQQLSTLKGNTQSLLEKKKRELEKLKGETATLRAKLNDCDEARKGLESDTTDLGARLRASERDMNSLNSSCKRMRSNYRELKSRSTAKMRDLVKQLENLQSDLGQREARLAVVEGRLRQRDSLMNSLRARLSDALLGFKKDGLTVDIKNGKVYVSLSNKLLFASGSTKIDENGQRALADLAGILKEQEDITIMVEGHTDDVPVS